MARSPDLVFSRFRARSYSIGLLLPSGSRSSLLGYFKPLARSYSLGFSWSWARSTCLGFSCFLARFYSEVFSLLLGSLCECGVARGLWLARDHWVTQNVSVFRARSCCWGFFHTMARSRLLGYLKSLARFPFLGYSSSRARSFDTGCSSHMARSPNLGFSSSTARSNWMGSFHFLARSFVLGFSFGLARSSAMGFSTCWLAHFTWVSLLAWLNFPVVPQDCNRIRVPDRQAAAVAPFHVVMGQENLDRPPFSPGM
jgi:hypothetical protein